MKVGILHNNVNRGDWVHSQFARAFDAKGVEATFFSTDEFEVDSTSISRIEELVNDGYTAWMNRVYPSSGDMKSIQKALALVSWLQSSGYFAVNPPRASQADYDKLLTYDILSRAQVPTPYTEILPKDHDKAMDVANMFGFPCIVKRRTGGCGKDVKRLDSKKHTEEYLEKILSPENGYQGQYIIQEFCQPSEDYDIRLCVVGDTPLIAYQRTLIDPASGRDNWMASVSNGSRIIPGYEPTEAESDAAIRATKAIGAFLNECDITPTERGPVVIECNPTPGYNPMDAAVDWVRLIVDRVTETGMLYDEKRSGGRTGSLYSPN